MTLHGAGGRAVCRAWMNARRVEPSAFEAGAVPQF